MNILPDRETWDSGLGLGNVVEVGKTEFVYSHPRFFKSHQMSQGP